MKLAVMLKSTGFTAFTAQVGFQDYVEIRDIQEIHYGVELR